MGCTSSAPNMLSASASKEDKSIQFEEDTDETYSKHIEAIHKKSENRTEIKVLPPSDTTEPVQLSRNNKSTTSLGPEKDLNTNGSIVESECESNDISETTKEAKGEDDNKMSKLKLEVVGKFIEITQQDPNRGIVENPNTDEAAQSTEKDNEKTNENIESNDNETGEEHGINSAEAEEADEAEEASPSQSQSSRATRWEALADIGAELPPSLTVDPITGQIYSLSK